MHRFSLLLFLALSVCLWSFGAQSAAGQLSGAAPDAEKLQALVAEGLSRNQRLQALAGEIDAAVKEISVAGTLDDPMIGFTVANLPTDTYRFDQEGMTQKQISITQRFPWFGKLDLRERQARLKVLHLQTRLTERRLDLVRRLTDDWYEIGLISESQRINQRMIVFLDQIIQVAESRYASGQGLQQDVLQAQVEQTKLMETAIELRKKRRTLEDRMHRLLNRETFLPIEPPVLIAGPEIEILLERWQQSALSGNAQVRIAAIEIDQAKVDLELARKAYWPDPDIRLSYGQRDSDSGGGERADLISAGVVFKLPVWAKHKQDKSVAASKERHAAALARYQDQVASLPYRVDEIAAQIENLQASNRLYVDAILIQARLWADAALSAYRVGKLEFNTMMLAQLRILTLELQALRSRYMIMQQRAALEELLGDTTRFAALEKG